MLKRVFSDSLVYVTGGDVYNFSGTYILRSHNVKLSVPDSAYEMTCIVSGGALNSTHSLTHLSQTFADYGIVWFCQHFTKLLPEYKKELTNY